MTEDSIAMSNGTEPLDIPILFAEPKSPLANFAVWPRNTNSPLIITLNSQLDSQDEPALAKQDAEATLRKSLSSVVESLGPRHPRIQEHINNLYYWRYKRIFENLRALKSLILRQKVASFSLPTKRGPTRRFTLSRGDEGPAIWVKPEYEFPFYIESLGPPFIGFVSNKRTAIGYLLAARPWFLFLLRLMLSTAGMCAQKVKCLLGSQKKSERKRPPLHSLAIARSWSQAEKFTRAAKELRQFDVNVGILVDLTLFQAVQRTPTWVKSSETTLIYSSAFFQFSDLFRASKSCISNALRSPKSVPFRLTDGKNEIDEEFGSINFELELSHIDHELHLYRVRRAIKATRPSSLISGESISPYIFSHGKLARENGLRSIRIQQVGVSADDFVSVGDIDHLILEDTDLANALKNQFPLISDAFEYLGHQNYSQDLSPRKLNDPIGEQPFRITYFTQPLDEAGNISIARALIDVFKDRLEKNELEFNIKLHPRDTADYQNLEFIRLIRSQESATEALEKTDFVISRSSSVLMDALAMGIPFIGVRLSSIDRNLDAPYFDNRLNAHIDSIASFISILNGLDGYIEDFTHRRHAFVTTLYQPFAWKRLSAYCMEKTSDVSDEIT